MSDEDDAEGFVLHFVHFHVQSFQQDLCHLSDILSRVGGHQTRGIRK